MGPRSGVDVLEKKSTCYGCRRKRGFVSLEVYRLVQWHVVFYSVILLSVLLYFCFSIFLLFSISVFLFFLHLLSDVLYFSVLIFLSLTLLLCA